MVNGKENGKFFIKAMVAFLSLYIFFGGIKYHERKIENELFLNKKYLEIRSEFKKARFSATPGGYINDYYGEVKRAILKKQAFMKKFVLKHPELKKTIERVIWEVRAVRNPLYGNREEHNFSEWILVPFGWEFPPFPWEKKKWKSYLEYPPYSEEK